MTKSTVKKRGLKGKAAGNRKAPRLSAADWTAAEQIRHILADPKAPRRVKGRLEELTYNLYAETNAHSEATPDSCAADFINGTAALLVEPDAEARAIYEELVRFAARYESEEHRVARRVAELYAAEVDRPGEGEGWQLLAEAADAVTAQGDEGVMLRSPRSEFFVPFFVKAARDIGRDHPAFVAVKELVARADAGEDLDQIAADKERRGEETRAEMRAAELARPEPKDKLSPEWRHWKLRQIEHAFGPENTSEEYNEAWRYCRDLLCGLYAAEDFWRVDFILPLLPHLISARQDIDEMDRDERRSRAAMRGAETRKKNKKKAAKKGGAS